MENFGLTMRDKITGFTGVVTGHVVYMTGCNQTLLAPKAKDGGDAVDARWYDDQRLEVVHGSVRIVLDNANAGSDLPAPKR